MKKLHRIRSHRHCFSHYFGRQGMIHTSQTLPAVLVAFYYALASEHPELAEQFRQDPLGIKNGMEAA